MTNGVPLAVPWPVTSRHLPDPTLTTAPLAWTRHCCVAGPVQSWVWTVVPSAVPPPAASRHLVSNTLSWLVVVDVQAWLLPLLQSHSAGTVPLAWFAAGT